MDKKMFKIGFLVGALLIAVVGVYGYFNAKSIMNDTAVKSIELTQLEVENLNGKKLIIKSGKPIVINFWATWCVPCVKEFPVFEALNKKYADSVDFLMVSDEETAKIEKFKTKKGYSLNIIRSLKNFEEYGLMLRPATYIYNAQGKLVSKYSGVITKEALEKLIKEIIK